MISGNSNLNNINRRMGKGRTVWYTTIARKWDNKLLFKFNSEKGEVCLITEESVMFRISILKISLDLCYASTELLELDSVNKK